MERDSNNICIIIIIINACSQIVNQNLALYIYRVGEVNDARGFKTKVISISSGSIDGCPGHNLLSGYNTTAEANTTSGSIDECPTTNNEDTTTEDTTTEDTTTDHH